MAKNHRSSPPNPTQEAAHPVSDRQQPEVHPRLQQWAEGAKSYLEEGTAGSPPVVVVNLDAQCILRHAAPRDNYWAGVSLQFQNAIGLSTAVLQLESRVSGRRAKANVRQLGANVFEEPFKRDYRQVIYGGVAIVVLCGCGSSTDARHLERTKDHERGHAIQRMIGKGDIDIHAPMAALYVRDEAQKFASNLRSNLYDPQDQACIVTELAMCIATGGWRGHGFSADEATAWMTAYFAGVREMHGDDAVTKFLPVLRTRVAKAAFRALQTRDGGTAVTLLPAKEASWHTSSLH